MKTTLWFIKMNGNGSYVRGFFLYLIGKWQRRKNDTVTITITH